MGTNTRPPTPKQRISIRLGLCACAEFSDGFSGATSSPFRYIWTQSAETTTDAIDGNISWESTPPVVIIPLIQSMMVVTSPIGEKAPPALAAIIIMPPKIIRSLASATSLRSTIIITMLVVRLSRMAERIKVMMVILQSSARLFLVARASCTKKKPPLASTISTIVMAPIRKKRISHVSPR